MQPAIDISEVNAIFCRARAERARFGPHTDKYVFKSADHASNALLQMNKMRKEGDMCNMELHTKGGKVLKAHRLVLAACSPFFEAMFRSDLIECRSGVVHLQTEDYDVMEQLIEYCYTCRIDITADNVQRLLPTADLLQITNVKLACCEFLAHHIDVSNVLGFWLFADRNMCDKLALKASIFIREKFVFVMREDEFLELPLDRLQWLTKHMELNIACEDQVCEAVLRWVGYNAKERSRHLLSLLNDVRLQLMHPHYLIYSLYQHPLVRNHEPTATYLRNFVVGETPNGSAVSYDFAWRRRDPGVKERIFPGLDDIVIMGGGDVFEQHASGERYSSQEDTWSPEVCMTTKRVRLSVTSVKGCLYVLGGHDGTICLRSVEVYDPLDGNWQPAQHMNYPRDSAAATSFEDKLYMIGGHNGTSRMNSVEVYDPDMDEWTDVSPMGVPLTSAAADSLGEYIYVCGGNDGMNFVDRLQRFHVHTDQWSDVRPLPSPRNRLGLTAHNGVLYVTGGLDPCGEWLSKCEKYDPETDTWTPIKKMNVSRCRHCTAVADGYMYALGGFGGTETIHLNSVERYDHETDEWHQVGPLIMRRGGAGCGVLSKRRPICPHKHANSKNFCRRESQC